MDCEVCGKYSSNSKLRFLSNLRPVLVEHERQRCHNRAQPSKKTRGADNTKPCIHLPREERENGRKRGTESTVSGHCGCGDGPVRSDEVRKDGLEDEEHPYAEGDGAKNDGEDPRDGGWAGGGGVGCVGEGEEGDEVETKGDENSTWHAAEEAHLWRRVAVMLFGLSAVHSGDDIRRVMDDQTWEG